MFVVLRRNKRRHVAITVHMDGDTVTMVEADDGRMLRLAAADVVRIEPVVAGEGDA